MRKNAFARHGKRAAARLRAIRRRAAKWKRRARQAVTLALIAATTASAPSIATAQTGQMGMAPAPGLGNRAAAAFRGLNENGPGVLYYGINGADRGLGYQGSYMTLGGYVPYGEDGLGGLWAADVRSHLSTYGGFFSNVGAVRKQFLGGSLLGIGIYWDYDGDLNQYSDTTITDISGSYGFAGGQVYNQVGISAEWLTDFGNIRSNGYIPVGETGEVMGPFVGNSLLCTPGINAALTGTDLEVGAYIPGLNDWAGMISVGGYAYGNSRYDLANGQDSVPWFGGVYTRLDMTFIENWDFSLQYNNDSYFDSTGFARLTYRMGGSRRRNVPDQMEQPMMRNEHIVRAHQAPVQAINPTTGTPWNVIHVDNSYTGVPSLFGTAAAPATTLAAANLAATRPFDIVFVHTGASQQTPYVTPAGGFVFGNTNQFLVGEGSHLKLPTVACGPILIGDSSATTYPVITNPVGTAVVLAQNNATVDHIQIQGSAIGIAADNRLVANGVATVNDVRIIGTGAGQRGVDIQNLVAGNATLTFTNMALTNLTNDGFYVAGGGGANPQVNIDHTRMQNTGGSAVNANNIAAPGRVAITSSTIAGVTGPVAVLANNATLRLNASTVSNAAYGLQARDNSVVQVVNSAFGPNVTNGVLAETIAPGAVLNVTVNNNTIATTAPGVGIELATPTVANGSSINASLNANVITPPATAQQIVLSSPAGAPTLNIQAVNQAGLRARNFGATVTPVTGVPAYNPVLVVPLPPP